MVRTLTEVFQPGYWESSSLEFPGALSDASFEKAVQGIEALRGHVLFRSSGSDGVPRWVALSKRALRWSAARVNEHLDCGRDDHWCCPLPVHHVGGYGIWARASVAGGKVTAMPGKWSPGAFARLCEVEEITVSSLVPTQVHDLVEAGCTAPGALRRVVVGGAALAPDLAERAHALGWPLRASYGMTETGAQIATELRALPDEPGLPLIAPWEARVDDAGVIAVRGEGLLSGYVVSLEGSWRLQEAVDSDGWFWTGDLGRLTDRGRLVVEGRSGRTVKILGELVHLERLEELWNEVTGKSGTMATSTISVREDPRRGFQVVLVTEEKWEAKELERLLAAYKERVAAYEGIESVICVPALPRGELGKVRHGEVQRMVAQASV